LLAALLVVRFADVFAAPRDVDLDVARPDFLTVFCVFFSAVRLLAAAFRADDLFAVFLAVRFRRGGCAAAGGISMGSDTRPSAANGM